jgi:hypothetical protein
MKQQRLGNNRGWEQGTTEVENRKQQRLGTENSRGQEQGTKGVGNREQQRPGTWNIQRLRTGNNRGW